MPLRISKIAGMFQFAFECPGSAISSMTRNTVFCIQLSSAPGADVNGLTAYCPAGERRAKRHGEEDK